MEFNKLSIILIIIALVLGFILGSTLNIGLISKKSCSDEHNEINVLNKEIDNCISELNNNENNCIT